MCSIYLCLHIHIKNLNDNKYYHRSNRLPNLKKTGKLYGKTKINLQEHLPVDLRIGPGSIKSKRWNLKLEVLKTRCSNAG